MEKGRPKRTDKGIALVSVLWSMVLLSLIAANLLSSGTMSYRMAHGDRVRTEAEATAEAGINRAILGLLDPRSDKRWRVDGTPINFHFGDTHMRVSIRDELGKIDLNAADPGVLVNLLRSAGVSADAASALVDKILDWREAGDIHRVDGAKADQYYAKGLSYAPRNGPFQAVDELRLVLDISPSLFSKIAPALTVYTGRQFIDPQFAPREALLAQPGMDPFRADQMITARDTGQGGASLGGAANQGAIDPSVSLGGRTFTVRCEVTAVAGPPIVREVVLRLTDDNARPYLVMAWH